MYADDGAHRQSFADTLSVKSGVTVTQADIDKVTAFTDQQLFLVALILVAKERVRNAAPEEK